MKTEQTIIDERERSGRKQAEIDAEVNTNKELVYNYIASRKDVIGAECVKELGFFAKGQRYLEWLSLRGHLVRMKRVIGGKRHYVYNAATPYIKPVAEVAIPVEEMDVKKKIASVTRVFKLMDREQAPAHKSERPKRRTQVSIGSSMSMFNSF